MKYNRISALLFLVFTFLFILLCNNILLAQNSTSSPYSRFGIGDISSLTFARNLGMGGTEIGLNQPGNINYGNPAAYSNLWFTTYEGGFDFTQYEFKTSSTVHHTNTESVSYFDFAFPVKSQKWGLGFGLLPYSKVGYLATSVSTNEFGDQELTNYEGSGGLNNFHIGSGFKISKKLSFGLNAEYLFGVINNDRTVVFSSPYYFNTAINSGTSIGWFHFKGGIQYKMDSLSIGKSDSLKLYEKRIFFLEEKLNSLINNSGDTSAESYERKNSLNREIAESKLIADNIVIRKKKTDWHLVLGLVASPTADLHAVNSMVINSFRYKYFQIPDLGVIIRDTVIRTEGEKSYVRLPFSTGIGFSLLKGSKWMFCADYTFQKWSEFSFLGKPDSLSDSWKISAGAQFTPNERAIKSYWKIMQYRLGFHYQHGYVKLNGININETALSAGFTMPIRKAGTFLHFTFEAGRQGTTLNNLVLENYFRFTFGFTINDRWFQKSKYD